MNILNDIKNKRDNIINGNINSFPYPFIKLNSHLPGFTMGSYIIITANTKVGKTQIADYIFILYPLFLLYSNRNNENNNKYNFAIEIISLELSILAKEYTIYSHFTSNYFIQLDNNINSKVAIADLKSITKPLDAKILNELVNGKLKDFFNFIKPYYNITDSIYTTNEILHYIHKLGIKYGSFTGTKWIPKDPNKYIIIEIDHISLLLSDKFNTNIFDSIGVLSKEIVKLKKIYYTFVFVVIQQQAAAAENIQSIQFRSGEPTLDNLGENKSTGRDADLVFGLYSPFRNKITIHENLNVASYKDNYRSLNVLADRHYGKIGYFTRLYFDGSFNNFSELNG